MAIFRIKKNINYTVMSNCHLKDKNMSLKAKGLLSLMLSLPDDWDYSVNGLVAICKENKTAIQNTLRELEENGYLIRTKIKNEKGQFDYEYDVYETPYSDNPRLDNPQLGNLFTDNLWLGNQPQLNTKELNTKELSTKELNIDNQYMSEGVEKTEPVKDYEEKFNIFYKAYPKKVAKTKVLSWFKSNKPKDDLFELMMKQLEVFKKSYNWNKDNGQYIPNPTTWLNQKRWEDEIEITNNLSGIHIKTEEEKIEFGKKLEELYGNKKGKTKIVTDCPDLPF